MRIDDPSLSPEERAEILRAKFPKSKPPAPLPLPPQPTYDDDLIPEAPYERQPEDQRLDGFLDQVDIVTAYRTFVRKMEPDPKGKTESIMVSCPTPGHADTNPSAWMNSDKGTWFCGGCQVGGDAYDFAAFDLGYPVPDYKTNGTFPKLRREMATRLGFTIVQGITGDETFYPPEPETPVALDPGPATVPINTPFPMPISITSEMPAEEDEVIDLSDFIDQKSSHGELLGDDSITINWEKIVPHETFLRDYLEECTIDDLPHEYHFFNGLLALGFTAGSDVFLEDYKRVKTNLYVCLYGRTGVGKSRSLDPLLHLLESVLPYNESDHYSPPSGVMQTSTPVSAEALLDMFKYELLDPSTNVPIGLAQIKGLVKIEELSGFVARASRMGSVMRETIIEMYDVFGTDVSIRGRISGLTKVKNPFVQMVTTTQPKAIHSFLRKTDTESGMLNRFLFAAGKPRVAPISYGVARVDLTRSLVSLGRVNTFGAMGHKYELKGTAYEAWDAFFHKELAQFKSGDEEMDSMVARVDLTLKKFITLFTLNEHKTQPDGDVVERALELYPYLQVTYSAFSGDISFNDVTECQNRVVFVIEKFQTKYGKAPSSNQIRQQIGKKFDLELIIRALKNLVILEVVQEKNAPASSRGRPSKRYGLAGF